MQPGDLQPALWPEVTLSFHTHTGSVPGLEGAGAAWVKSQWIILEKLLAQIWWLR